MNTEDLLFQYVQRVEELKTIVANQTERIANLERIGQALADELIEWDEAVNALAIAKATI